MAHAHASEALLLCEELEDTRGIAHSLEVFAGLLAAAGFAEAAVRLWGAAEAAWQMWAACLRRRFDGYEIAISRELKCAAGELLFEAGSNGRACNVIHAGD